MNTLLLAASAFDITVNKLRSELMYVAFALVVIGIWESSWKSGSDPKAILGILLKTIIIISLITFFPSIINKSKELFEGLRNMINSDSTDRFKDLLNYKLPKVDAWSIGDYIA